MAIGKFPEPESEFLKIMVERGFIHQATNFETLDGLMASRCVPAYIGFDCTADSLHVGSLVQIMMLRWLQKAGHKPIVLMGGGTTKIGDPSGKDSQRPLLSEQDIEKNKNGIRKIFEKYLVFGDGKSDAIMLDNAAWLDGLNYITFLRDYGTHFPMTQLLGMESIKTRLQREQDLSFLEFNYAIMQAYDFMELHRRHDCLLQMGGSDQWGNIIRGIELVRRVDATQIFGLTSPLIATASGAKMGKTAEGAVWLDAAKTSIWDFRQYWRNTEDGDVGRFLRLFTELPVDEIARYEKLEGSELNEAKDILANEATALAHSREEAEKAAAAAHAAFTGGGVAAGLPEGQVAAGAKLIEALEMLKLVASRSEARRHIRSRAVRLNDEVIADEFFTLGENDFPDGGKAKVMVGKKRHGVLVKK